MNSYEKEGSFKRGLGELGRYFSESSKGDDHRSPSCDSLKKPVTDSISGRSASTKASATSFHHTATPDDQIHLSSLPQESVGELQEIRSRMGSISRLHDKMLYSQHQAIVGLLKGLIKQSQLQQAQQAERFRALDA